MVYIINKGKHFKPHYNRAMGKFIRSERQYKEEMKRGGYCSHEEAKERVKRHYDRTHKPYVPTRKAHQIVEACHPDRHGNVSMPGRAIDALKDMGVTFDKKKIEEMTKEKQDAIR